MTVQECLVQIEDIDIRDRALYNARVQGNLDEHADNIYQAITIGIIWDNTIQGHDYWKNIYNKYKDENSRMVAEYKG